MQINVVAHKLIKEDGYGRYAMHVIRQLSYLGVAVRPGEMRDLDLPGWMQRLQGYDFSRLTLSIMPAYELRAVPGRQWVLTMWEDDQPPDDCIDGINDYAERVIVPCEHNAEAFRKAGVRAEIPIHVIHGGTSPEEFPLLPAYPMHRPYTFMALGDRSTRKGVEVAWSAFFNAFPAEQDVRLLIKARLGSVDPHTAFICNDPRVSWWIDDTDSMADVYPHADCFVYPGYGDGWGMPPREAAMMGLPVIATDWSGTAVGIDYWALPLRQYTLIPTTQAPYIGCWVRPDYQDVATHMRWCYENRDAARQFGRASSLWLRANQTWEHTARALLKLMEEHN